MMAHETIPPVEYRSDIDGLRAIAVLSVIAYHLASDMLPGGYLGVDIFFVISGFLITQILKRDLELKKFNLRRFYERRVRRIAPALLLVLACSTLAASVLLLPTDLTNYARSLLATLGFVANVYFWRDTNYFSRAAEDKPLLHLWSLSVEEQFYLMLPILLLVVYRWCRSRFDNTGSWQLIGWLLFVGVALSLAANILALRWGASSPAFYGLPTRAWELGAGSAVALLAWKLRGKSAALLGWPAFFVLIATLLGVFPSHAAIPTALPVVFAAGVLILPTDRCWIGPQKLLSTPALVGVGIISYSLYLWHWPAIVFSKYFLIRELSNGETISVAIFTVAISVATWRWIEQPARRSPAIAWKTLATITLSLTGSALVLIQAQGLPSRLEASAARINQSVGTNYRCPVFDYLPFGSSRACRMYLDSGNVLDSEVVLLGNSHAQMLAPLFRDLLKDRKQAGLLVPLNGCLPITSANLSVDCIDAASVNLDEVLRLPHLKTVVIAFNWALPDQLVDADGRMTSNGSLEATMAGLDSLVKRIQAAGRQAVVLGPLAEPGWDLASQYSRELQFKRSLNQPISIARSEFDRRYQRVIESLSSRKDITFVPMHEVQCGTSSCAYILEGESLFADSNHLAVSALPRWRPAVTAALVGSLRR
jgi:peptidoglycan/LPS O-acetylase OafA/YrhL